MFRGVLFQGGNPVVYVEVNWDGAVFSVEMRANDKSGAVIGALTSQSFAGESSEIQH